MSGRRGFTLVEILLVMLITSVLVMGIHAIYRQARALWSQAEDQRHVYHLVRVLTETLREELSGLYIPPAGAGDDEQRPEPGVQLGAVADRGVELRFFTLTPAWRSDVQASEPARVRYQFVRDGDAGGTFLERSQALCAGEKVIGPDTTEVLARGLAEFKIWALDPEDTASPDAWKESYESSDRPPKAIRLLFAWHVRDRNRPNAEVVEFESVIPIPCEGPLVSQSN